MTEEIRSTLGVVPSPNELAQSRVQQVRADYPSSILVTACGAKVPLLRAIREACHLRGVRLLGSDLDPLAPALAELDQVVSLPSWRDDDWGDQLRHCCATHHVGMVVGTADGELPYLLAARPKLLEMGVAVVGPLDPAALLAARDKRVFTAHCRALGLGVAREWGRDEVPSRFPVFARLPTGQGGQSAWRVESLLMLNALRALHSDLLVQDYVGDAEYSIDVLSDFDGKPLQAVVRRRLVVRGGEAWTSRVEDVPILRDQAMTLCAVLRLSGHSVVQAFWSAQSGPRFIEVNPRFGGASSLALRAGLDSPGRLLDLLAGDSSAREPRDIAIGMTLMRYGEDRFVHAASLRT